MLDQLKDSVIVVAHPDDEILWFSSLLKRAAHVLFCFSDELYDPVFGARRRSVVENYPLKNTSTIDLVAAGRWRPESFVNPKYNKYGIEIVGNDDFYSIQLKKYKENYYAMRKKLAGRLSQYRHVFTHNPWGEYGHEEHVQLHRVICELQKKIGYNIWYSGYCSTRTVGLIDPHACISDSLTLPTDSKTAEKLMHVYEQKDCWTWYKGWRWPQRETFFKKGAELHPDIEGGTFTSLHLIAMPPLSNGQNGVGLRTRRRLQTLARSPASEATRYLRKISGLSENPKPETQLQDPGSASEIRHRWRLDP